jgi:hypothetical protein
MGASVTTHHLHAYAIMPLDFGWNRLRTVKEYLKLLIDQDDDGDDSPAGLRKRVTGFLDLLEAALERGKEIGWEGDFRAGHEPHVIELPGDVSTALAFVWKQENNGSTFVISEEPLAYLERLT